MSHAEILAMKRRELVDLANAMLAGEIDLIQGVRTICRLRFEVEDPDNEVFLAVRGIESETDSFPVGAMRSTASAEYLIRADAEMQQYLAEAKGDILQACREIITTFS